MIDENLWLVSNFRILTGMEINVFNDDFLQDIFLAVWVFCLALIRFCKIQNDEEITQFNNKNFQDKIFKCGGLMI